MWDKDDERRLLSSSVDREKKERSLICLDMEEAGTDAGGQKRSPHQDIHMSDHVDVALARMHSIKTKKAELFMRAVCIVEEFRQNRQLRI